ncbi:MAG: ECF transporter S component [Saccharofermentanales bacterium]
MNTPETISTTTNDNFQTTSRRRIKTRDMVTVSFLLAIIAVLSVTPLGFVRLPLLPELTIIHVPVIIGSILLGPIYGAFLGFAFGLSSLLNATFAPGVLSFAFSPFYSVGELSGNGWSIFIAFVPRILVGITPWLVYKGLRKVLKFKGTETFSLAVAGVAGSLTNTIFVLGFIGLFFTGELASLMGAPASMLFKIIMGVVATNGVPEAVLAGVVTVAVCKAAFVIGRRTET